LTTTLFAAAIFVASTTTLRADPTRDTTATPASTSATSAAQTSPGMLGRPPLITRRELEVGGLAVLATFAVAPLDHPVEAELQEPRWQNNGVLRSTTHDLAFIGGPGGFMIGVGLYATGVATRTNTMASVGLHTTEALLLAGGITALGKGLAGCALPGVQTAESCELGRGFHHNNGPFVSFPSGHTAAGFAIATTLTKEASHWHSPFARMVAPVAFTTAGAIAFARLYQHVHWPSDLPVAAAIGTWSGLTIENASHHGHASSGDTPQARLIPEIVPLPSGVAVAWALPFGHS